jgi:hypothetical protein
MNGVGYYRYNLIRISSAREHQKALPSAGPSPMSFHGGLALIRADRPHDWS